MVIPSSELWRFDLALGSRYVIGADEAGRGAWAGPITGAAVMLDLQRVEIEPLMALNDSKKLTPKARQTLLAEIDRQRRLGHLRVSRCVVSPARIDRLGIQPANLRVLELPIQRTGEGLDDLHAMADAFTVPGAQSIIRGDSTSAAIAAASIVAKCLRDQIMAAASVRWPQYDFAAHKGYGSARHKSLIAEHGVSSFHRASFRPMKDIIARSRAADAPAPADVREIADGDDEWTVRF
jgi:ribonuclease HII